MKAGVSVEVRLPQGSVQFQAHLDVADESVRVINKDLQPGQSFRVNPGMTVRELAIIAAQSEYLASVTIGTAVTILEGQQTTDFGLLWCVRGNEEFGSAPWPDELNLDDALPAIVVKNESDRRSNVRLMLAALPEEPVAVPGIEPLPELSAAVEQPEPNSQTDADRDK